MARVPTSPLPTERNAPAPVVFRSSEGVTPDAFGAAEARATERMGQQISQQADVLADRAIRMQQEDNIAEAKRVDVEFTTAMRVRQQEFMETSQNDTVQGYDKALEDIEELRRSALSGISNPRVLEMATNQFHSRIEAAFNSMAVHVAAERNANADAMGDALIDLGNSAALANPGNEDVLAAARQTILDEFADKAERGGWGPEQVESEVLAATTLLHSKMIDALLENDPGLAVKYFADHKDEIDGVYHADLQEKLRVIIERTKAQDRADWIMEQGWTVEKARIWVRDEFEGTLEDSLIERVNILFGEEMGTTARAAVEAYMADGLSEDAARERAKADYVGALQDSVLKMVNTEYAAKKRFEDERVDALVKSATEQVITGETKYDDLTVEEKLALGTAGATRLLGLESNRADRGRVYPKYTDHDAINELDDLFSASLEDFAAFDLSLMAHRLSETDYNSWQRIQRSVEVGLESATPTILKPNAAIMHEARDHFLSATQFSDPEPGTDEAVAVAKINSILWDYITKQAAEGHEVTYREIEGVMSGLFMSGGVLRPSGKVGDKELRMFEVLETGDERRFTLTDMEKDGLYIASKTGIPVNALSYLAERIADRGEAVRMHSLMVEFEQAIAEDFLIDEMDGEYISALTGIPPNEIQGVIFAMQAAAPLQLMNTLNASRIMFTYARAVEQRNAN